MSGVFLLMLVALVPLAATSSAQTTTTTAAATTGPTTTANGTAQTTTAADTQTLAATTTAGPTTTVVGTTAGPTTTRKAEPGTEEWEAAYGTCTNHDKSKCQDSATTTTMTTNDCCVAKENPELHSCADGYHRVETQGRCGHAPDNSDWREFSCIPPGADRPVGCVEANVTGPCIKNEYSKCRDYQDDCCVERSDPEDHHCEDGYQLVETQHNCAVAPERSNLREYSCIPPGADVERVCAGTGLVRALLAFLVSALLMLGN